MAQMETMRRDIEATNLKTADERNAAKVLKAEGAELQERLAEARGDIIMLQKKMDAVSRKGKESARERVPLVSRHSLPSHLIRYQSCSCNLFLTLLGWDFRETCSRIMHS